MMRRGGSLAAVVAARRRLAEANRALAAADERAVQAEQDARVALGRYEALTNALLAENADLFAALTREMDAKREQQELL